LPTASESAHDQQPDGTQTIRRAIWVTLAALVIVLFMFTGYYIWDRYVHPGDQSPLDLNIQHMEEAISREPQDPEARLVLAESYLNAGRYAEALAQAEQVADLYPDNEGALLLTGITQVRLGNPEAALTPLQRFVAQRKDQPMAHSDKALEAAYYFLGESYVKIDQPAEAITALEAALALNPVDADALYQLGLAYQATGQPQRALENYHRAVKLVPNFAEAYQGMVESYAVLEQPHHQTYAQGMVAYSQQDYQSAVTYLDQASKSLPDFAPAYLGAGLTLERVGELEAALAAVQRSLELDPGDLAAQQALGRIQAMLNSRN